MDTLFEYFSADIRGLIPDPHFTGGAFHQILPGGKLDVHADLNVDKNACCRDA